MLKWNTILRNVSVILEYAFIMLVAEYIICILIALSNKKLKVIQIGFDRLHLKNKFGGSFSYLRLALNDCFESNLT